jgi:hypothetical protein
MFAGRMRWAVLATIVLSALGCVNSGTRIKPPKQPDQYILPPSASYNTYPTYPARVMGEGRIMAAQKDDQKDAQPGFNQGGGMPH